MNIAITGGSGRIGQAVVAQALANGHQVVSIDQRRSPRTHDHLRVIEADIANYGDFEAAIRGCDALIHLAAIPSPVGHAEHVVHHTNVVGSYNALCAAVAVGIRRVCQASSVNATGAAYSRWPSYDYFPVDEQHSTYNEDAYSLSKWICEQQADSIARRHSAIAIASLRFHWVVPDRATAEAGEQRFGDALAKHLWGYTLIDSAVQAVLNSLQADFVGHEVFQIVEPDTMMSIPSPELALRFFPEVPIRGTLTGDQGFFDCSKARRMLGMPFHDLKQQ
jgi:nucleoside-diphosphate-sugar epimerase